MGSTFQNNRARGLLLFTSNVLVEDTVIDSPSMECVMAEPDGCHWLEGTVASNVVFRNVTLRGCAHSQYSNPGPVEHSTAIFLGECVPTWKDGVPTSSGAPVLNGREKVFANWTIERSRFEPAAGS